MCIKFHLLSIFSLETCTIVLSIHKQYIHAKISIFIKYKVSFLRAGHISFPMQYYVNISFPTQQCSSCTAASQKQHSFSNPV